MTDEPTSKAARWERTHARILGVAARLLRTRGLRLPSVADVMKGAELTVGGFYGHWSSKEALFEEALRDAMRANWHHIVAAAKGDAPTDRLLSVVRRYLSRLHRDNPDLGCPLPVALGEVAMLGDPYRGAVAEELDTYIAGLARLADPIGGKQLALGLLALMVGGLSLARATAGTPLSDAVLTASRALAQAALERAEQKSAQ